MRNKKSPGQGDAEQLTLSPDLSLSHSISGMARSLYERPGSSGFTMSL
jgi:hypothetical protein